MPFNTPNLEDMEGRSSISGGSPENKLKHKPSSTEELSGFTARQESLAYQQAKQEVHSVLMGKDGYIRQFANARDQYLKEIDRANDLMSQGKDPLVSQIAEDIIQDAEARFSAAKADFIKNSERIREINTTSFAKLRAAEIIANKQAGEIAAYRESIEEMLDLIQKSEELLKDPDFQEEVTAAEAYLNNPKNWDSKAELSEGESLEDWHKETAAMAKSTLADRTTAEGLVAAGSRFKRELETGMSDEEAEEKSMLSNRFKKAMKPYGEAEREADLKAEAKNIYDEYKIDKFFNKEMNKIKQETKQQANKEAELKIASHEKQELMGQQTEETKHSAAAKMKKIAAEREAQEIQAARAKMEDIAAEIAAAKLKPPTKEELEAADLDLPVINKPKNNKRNNGNQAAE